MKKKQVKRRTIIGMTRNKIKGELMALMQSITTVHGTGHFSFKEGKALRLWCYVMIGNIFITIAFVMVIKDKFNENQIVTQINANCKVNQVPFPAVSLCNFNLVSLRESSNIANLLRKYNRTEVEIEEFFKVLPRLKDYNHHSRNIGVFSEIMQILKMHFFTMDTIMEEVHQKCENLLLECSFNRYPMKCENIFRLVKTYEGFCCSFNYAALNDVSEVRLMPAGENLEYYEDQNEQYYEDEDEGETTQTTNIITTSESGSSSGLSVVLNVEPEDYPTWATVPYYGAKILLSDPNDYPENYVLYRYISPGESMNLKVDALVFQSETSLRRVEPLKRGCWFFDEVTLEHTDRYSFETCQTECNMKAFNAMCGCIPYKYPREKFARICELEDLRCLNNVTAMKSKKEVECKSFCYMECRDKKYSITSDLVPFLGDEVPANVTQGRNVSQLAALKVFFGKSSCNCYKLMLLIDVNYFIATYGGVFSLSFGASILTIFELTYFLVAILLKTLFKIVVHLFGTNGRNIVSVK